MNRNLLPNADLPSLVLTGAAVSGSPVAITGIYVLENLSVVYLCTNDGFLKSVSSNGHTRSLANTTTIPTTLSLATWNSWTSGLSSASSYVCTGTTITTIQPVVSASSAIINGFDMDLKVTT